MPKKARTFRSTVLFVVIITVVVTATAIQFFAHRETEMAMLAAHDEHALNLLNTVVLNVENEYQSIKFHESATLERRKAELKNIVTIGKHCIDKYYQQHKAGLISEEDAKLGALKEIQGMRYADGVGYIWINDTGRPFPKMLMHPTISELDGKILDDPRFNCAMGVKENLFSAAVDVCLKNGSGYVDYLWPKPTDKGLTEDVPKISHVGLFKPWKWVVGTGVYIDDVEEEREKRFDAVMSELRKTFSNVKLAETGYMHIFTGDKKVLIHPVMEKGTDISYQINALTGENIVDELMETAATPSVPLLYAASQAESNTDPLLRKRAYVRYFEPLDWYICASVYDADIAIPAHELQKKILFLSSLILLAAMLFAVFISKSIIKPLKELTSVARDIERDGIHSAEIPVSGTSETVELGTILNSMIASIKESEREITLAHSYIDNIIDSMPSVLIGVGADDKVTLWNSEAARITGILAADAVGQSLAKAFPRLAGEIERVHEAMQAREVRSDSRQARTEGEEIHYEDVTVYPLLANGVEGAVIRVDDVTERERLIAKLGAQNAELERFTYTVSHDLKSPLITINGYVGMLSRDLEKGDSGRVKDDLARISNAASKMDQLLKDLLELSRIGRLANPPEDVSLERLSREALELVGGQVRKNGVQVEISTDLPMVFGDRLRLREVLQNLIDNAVKYMGEQPQPRVEVGSRRENNEAIIFVQDNGIGIDHCYQDKVFGLFDQLNPKAEGSGIGLALVKRIIEVHGGRIWVESEGLGHGTTFCFTIAEKEKGMKTLVPEV